MRNGAFVPYEGDGYLDWPAVEAWCRAAAEAHPDWVKLETVGQSREGRPLLLLAIGASGERERRPGFWLDGGTHASEWTGVMAALYTASRWLTALAAGDAETRRWFSAHTAYIMPCISPDGFDAICRGAPFLRSGRRPPPDGTVRVGLDPQDIDGDGVVRLMRWRHPAGPFVADAELPMLMRPRRLGDDPAEAYFVCDEGLLLEWDGARWSSASLAHGLDLNRNFPVRWSPFLMFGMDGGAYPLSEPESRAVVDAFAARSVAAGLTLHTYTGALLTQPYRPDSPLGTDDIELMERLAREITEGTDYRVLRVHPDFAYDDKNPIVGVWADTMADTFGAVGYTLELWDPFRFAGVANPKPAAFFANPDPAVVRGLVAAFSKLPGAIVPWRAFDHAQLGPIEIGGLDYLRTIRNPPIALLPAECARGFAIADHLRRALPRVEASLTCTPEGELTRVTLVLENVGYLSTSALRRGEKLVVTPAVSAALALDGGAVLVDGAAGRMLDHLDGWGSIRAFGGHPIYPALAPRGHRASATWWIRGAGEVVVTWHAGRGGRGRLSAKI